jgi:hypothetical protein
LNSIWEITNLNGILVKSSKKKAKAKARRDFYGRLFMEPMGCPIEEILKVASFFRYSLMK